MSEQPCATISDEAKLDLGLGLISSTSTTTLLLPKGKDDFSSVEEVEKFYNLPRAKEKKVTGKSASCEYEAFKEGLYLPTALFHCFKTQGQRLPLWILAMTKILYSESFSSQHDVEWIDRHDDKGNFVDIEIRIKDLKGNVLWYVITVHLDTNRVSVQGQNYLEFINSIFPDILKLVDTLGNAHRVADKKLITKPVQVRSVGKKFKNVDDPQHDSEGSFKAAAQIKNSENSMASISEDIAGIQASLQKLNINELLQTVILNQNSINDRLNALESKLQSSSQTSTPADLSVQFQDVKIHMSKSAKEIADSLREDFKEISSRNSEVSLLMEEIDSKNKEISVLKDRVKMLQKATSKLESLEKENEALRNELSKHMEKVDQLQQNYDKHQIAAESLSLHNKNLEEEVRVLAEKSL